MTFHSFVPQVGIVGLLAAVSVSAFPQEMQLSTVVVTANRTEQPIQAVVADITVIDREEIERSGAGALADLLTRSPGLQFARNGVPGSTTSVFLRGADTRFTAVYVDGVRIDTQSGSGGVTWEALPLSQIDHIEILRGPAAAIYGSDAVGGVVQIFTRRGGGRLKPYLRYGLGSYGTQKSEAGLSGATGNLDYALGLAHERSEGFNTKTNSNPDRDGYTSHAANLHLGLKVNADHRLEATALNSHLNSEYDSSLKAEDHSVHGLSAAGLAWKARWTDRYQSRVQLTEGKDHYDTYPSIYSTDTLVKNHLWHNEYRIGRQLWTAALERREDQLQNSATRPATTLRSQDAVALSYGFHGTSNTLQINARHDIDSEFGGKSTSAIAYAYRLTPQWRATASTGTAFRVPSLFQRFSPYGSASLTPETSQNEEVGLKYQKSGESFSVTYHHNTINNLISYVRGATECPSGSGCYRSTKHARLEGVTVAAEKTCSALTVGASLDWLDPKDLDTGKILPRRARQHGTFTLEAPVQDWSLGGELRIYGHRYDDDANNSRLPGYGLLNLFAQRKLAKDYTLLLRIDNLADHAYQLAKTYDSAGRSVFLGIRWAPN